MTISVASSVPGHAYQICATESLVSPDWQPVGTEMPGIGSDLIIPIPINGALPHCFFTLEVQRQ